MLASLTQQDTVRRSKTQEGDAAVQEQLLKEGPKPKWGCFSIAAPAAAVALLLLTWLVIA